MATELQPAPPVTNSQFLRELAQAAPNGSMLWTTSFVGTPDLTDARNWSGRAYNPALMSASVDKFGEENSYFSVAALVPTADGVLRRRKSSFSRLLALVADDVQLEDIQGSVSYVLETSPGKTQVGVLIDGACRDAGNIGLVDRLVTTMAERGLLKADTSGNNAVRYVRLPVGQNQKPRESGAWAHKMLRWAPSVRMSLEDAAASFGVDLDELRHEVKPQAGEAGSGIGRQGELLRLLTTNVVRGERLHESINEIAGSLVATGVPGGAAVNILRALMESSTAAKDERWLARFTDIPRSVSTAEEKFKRGFSIAGLIRPPDEYKLRRADVDFGSLKPVKWVLGGFIAAGEVVVWAGQPGVGKSTVFAALALVVAGYGPEIGSDIENDRPRRVLIVSEHPEQYAGIFYAFCQRYGIDAKVLADVVVLFNAARLNAAEIGHEVLHLIEQGSGDDPPLVILDTASASFDVADENSNAEIGGMLAALKRPITETGAPLWVISHAAKALGREDSEITPRGASAYIGDVHGTGSVFRDKSFPNSTFLKSLKNRAVRDYNEIEVRTEVMWHQVVDERGVLQRVGIRVGVPVVSGDQNRQQAASEAAQESREAEKAMRHDAIDARILAELGQALGERCLVNKQEIRSAIKDRGGFKLSDVVDRLDCLIKDGQIVEFQVDRDARPNPNFRHGLSFPSMSVESLNLRARAEKEAAESVVPKSVVPLKEIQHGNDSVGAKPPNPVYAVPSASGTAGNDRERQGTTVKNITQEDKQ